MSARLTPQREAEIAARAEAASPSPWFLHEDWPGRVFSESEFNHHIARVTGTNPERNEAFIAHAREDVPALLAELAAVRAELADLKRTSDRDLDDVMKERDEYHEVADKLAEAVAPIEVIGEHSSMNDPWANALDLITPKAEVDRLKAELAKVAEFVAKRAEYITAINNCSPNNRHDYLRWQGHAESRRQLAQQLGLPIAWPADYEQGATS